MSLKLTNESNIDNIDIKTNNGASAYSTTCSACLDFFGSICRSEKKFTPEIRIKLDKLLPQMWNENPLYMLKLIFYKRDCREGAGEKAIFYHCYNWLFSNHPDVAYKNLIYIPFYGYWKDLLNLLVNSDEGQDTKDKRKSEIAKIFAQQLKVDKILYENCSKSVEKHLENIMEEKKNYDNDNPNKIDIQKLEKDNKNSISLCAKWAPSTGMSFDKQFQICKLIANELGYNKDWQKQYRKHLSSLRSYLDITEKYMCAKLWNLIKLDKVPSLCMMKHKKAFQKNMPKEYQEWLDRLKSGKGKVNAKQLMLHELVDNKNLADELTQHQWNTLREHIRTKGSLKGIIPIADTSGSMEGIPMLVSISMAIMISELAEEPFKDLMITFSSNPEFFKFTSNASLKQKVLEIRRSNSIGLNTDIIKTFNTILSRCVNFKVKQENMPKKVLIITDGQFDEQTRNNDKTCFQNIKKMYQDAGYEVPILVLWNVNGSVTNVPVTKHETGTILISGWSPNLLKSIIESTDLPTPMEVMLQVINNERYDRLNV